MMPKINVAILGATGFGAGELLRLLTQHPCADVVCMTSTSAAGMPVHNPHPHMRGFSDVVITESVDFDLLTDADEAVIFSALPHGVSGKTINTLLGKLQDKGLSDRVRIIDLSGDMRLDDVALHEHYYPKSPFLPDLRKQFVYALPELGTQNIQGTRLISNPGCLATASILAAAPLAIGDYCGTLVFDAKTGSSGSGRHLKETAHHPTRHANFRAYKPLSHQHQPEILQALNDPSGQRIAASFVAQSLDTTRGIFVTLHLTLPKSTDTESIHRLYTDFYADAPFVRIVEGSPELQNVVGSNFCDIAVACKDKQVIVMTAIDNLIKGMAGTAIQNMNISCGMEQTTGLWIPSLRPV